MFTRKQWVWRINNSCWNKKKLDKSAMNAFEII